MANAIYGVNEGQTEFDVVYSATSLSTDVKVTVDLTKFPLTGGGQAAKADILKALEMIQNYILKDSDGIYG